ncbi:PREDICTED: uncharacterized protein LOC108661146 [Theobroma cacao]|uniref:Uncharacterized protein LOC108661146 n=1 Tax=Theobroma cacao TaxID=3641 RepID=A0AB32W495_THECC|nr:PREDICTED: uncharacterized protein LOC108661146 [Theobroma cacao]
MPPEAVQALTAFFTAIVGQAQASQALLTVPPAAPSVPPPPPPVPPLVLDVSISNKLKEARRMRAELAKRKNLTISSSQPPTRGKDSSVSGSTTIVSVTSSLPPFSQTQQRPSRFNRSAMTISGKRSGSFDKCKNCERYHVGPCRGPIRCFYCGQLGHIRRDCPQLGLATVAAPSPLACMNMQRRDSSGLQPRQG